MIKKHEPSVYTLRPRLPATVSGLYAAFLDDLSSQTGSSVANRRTVQTALAAVDAAALPPPDRLSARLFFEILGDLLRQGWEFQPDPPRLRAIAPDSSARRGGDTAEIKRALRATLTSARDEVLAEGEVRNFVLQMERPRAHRGRQVSVLNLLTDPHELARDLRRRAAAPSVLRDELLLGAVQPYLQSVTDVLDEHTGLSLRDIWRYCRYTWSLPLGSQPGRRMHYLVRDGARPDHPIMGIGALGSSVVQITCRDQEIGWSLESLHTATDLPHRVKALEVEIENSLAEIYTADFREEGILEDADLVAPTAATLAALEGAAAAAPLASRETVTQHLILDEDARSPLFRRKRAVALRQLLGARRTFQRFTLAFPEDDAARAAALLKAPDGQLALRVAIRSVKQRHIGASMMDITTCGAIPPYGTLLGGKLVALLMASAQVVSDYQARYAGASSHIASRMRGAELIRHNRLALLCTTSLYHVGSSQYNRLRAPTARGEINYRFVGTTKGFGSVHLSRHTYRTLQALLREHPDLARQGYGFGNGVNYKIRSIAAALNHLGLGALQKHEAPRRVYLVPLAVNWREYLSGLAAETIPVFGDVDNPASETAELTEFWKHRWFLPRVHRAETLRDLETQTETARVSRLANTAGEDVGEADVHLEASARKLNRMQPMPSDNLIPWQTIAELKGKRASFAELLSDSELTLLHVPTRLDAALVKTVCEERRRVYLTGNPGDGKTHIIQKHRVAFEEVGAFINLDASATDEEPLVEGISLAIAEGRPAIIAINEGPLRRLLRRLPDSEQEPLRIQVDQPFVYDASTSAFDSVVVNLGLRQVLALETLNGVLDVMLNRVDYSTAPAAIRFNHQRLSHPRVRERLFKLLEYLATGGLHVTMHELLGFFAYIITGGEASPEHSATTPPYYDLVFNRANPFGSELSEFDPVRLGQPLIDAMLWDGTHEDRIEWIEAPTSNSPINASGVDEARRIFDSLKRQFFFEASSGDQLFNLLPEDRSAFYNLFKNSSALRDTAKADILEAISRFFGAPPENTEDGALPVWTGLRYEADGAPTAFVASRQISAEDIDLLVPQLRLQTTAMLEYLPNHIRLSVQQDRVEGDPPALDIDLPLWLELMRIRRGTPPRYRGAVAERRLARFLARVAARLRRDPQTLLHLRVRDVEAGVTHNVGVSLDQNRYRL